LTENVNLHPKSKCLAAPRSGDTYCVTSFLYDPLTFLSNRIKTNLTQPYLTYLPASSLTLAGGNLPIPVERTLFLPLVLNELFKNLEKTIFWTVQSIIALLKNMFYAKCFGNKLQKSQIIFRFPFSTCLLNIFHVWHLTIWQFYI
jgi:hypothetical protein